jgi:hypothetical protein
LTERAEKAGGGDSSHRRPLFFARLFFQVSIDYLPPATLLTIF